MSNDKSEAFGILEDNLNLLTNTLQKQEFVKMVFDSNLCYEKGIYRTPAVLDLVLHNHLKMKEKGLLIYKKRGAS